MTSARRLIGAAIAGLLVPTMAWSARSEELPESRSAEISAASEPTGSATRPTVRVRDLGAVEARTAALLLSGQSGGNLPAAVLWCTGQETDNEGRVAVHLFVELDGRELLANAPPERVPVAISAYALDEQGVVLGSLAFGVVVEGKGLVATFAPGGLKFIGQMALPPGSVSLRVMIQVHGTDRFQLTRDELRITSSDSGEVFVSVPLFSAPEDTWLEARQQGDPALVEFAHGLAPAARPVLDITRPMNFVALASGWPQRARLQASVVDRWGRTVEQPQLSISGTQPAGGTAEIMNILMSPFDVPQGEYRVVLQVLNDASMQLASQSLNAVLVHGEAPATWVRTAQRDVGLSASVQAPVVSQNEPDDRELRSAYSAALRVMADGNEMAARRAVADLERTVIEANPRSGLNALFSAELRVARMLKNKNRRSLSPLIVLHHNLCRTYVAYGENILAHHSALMVAELAEMIGTVKDDSAVDDLAEYSLVSTALDLLQGLDRGMGGRMLERTLALDSKSVPALTNLAFLREQTGHWDETVDLLRKLVSVDPDNLEAQLRLGVNLRRTGHPGAARKAMRELLGDSTPDWIRSIAVQELSHMLVRSGRVDEAENLLLQAIEHTGDQQTLAIQLAWIRDRAGKSAEATATLVQVEQDIGRSSDSARLRYCLWPTMERYKFGAVLRREADGGLPYLLEALGAREQR